MDSNDCSEEKTDSNQGIPEIKTVKEGQANVFLPRSVFYNPVQEFNRDLTIAVISQHARDQRNGSSGDSAKRKTNQVEDDTAMEVGAEEQGSTNESAADNKEVLALADNLTISVDKTDVPLQSGKRYEDGLSILEGLAASGLRSTRFALEIPGVKEIIANDFSESAVEFIDKNIQHNNVEHLLTSSCDDAAMVMYRHRHKDKRFDVIDLDPYGTPAPFLDSAVQAIQDGGLLCVTCTDMAILCGNAPEACHAKYGSLPLRGRYCHEMALRIVLRCIESHANRYGRYIKPLMSVSVDFYCRVFVKVYSGAKTVKNSITKLSHVYGCYGCGDFTLHPLAGKQATKGDGNFKYTPSSPAKLDRCVHCGSRYNAGGPIWSAPIHEKSFVSKVLDSVKKEQGLFGTAQRIIGMLSVIGEELEAPLYYVADELYSVLHCAPATLLQIRSALLHAGFKVSWSHAVKNSLKTNAPTQVIWDVLRCWVKLNPVSEIRLKNDIPARTILSKEPELDADFTLHDEANPESRKKGLLRWQNNPERDWGPKARASSDRALTLEEKRRRGQEKAMEKRAKRKLEQKMEAEKKRKEEEIS